VRRWLLLGLIVVSGLGLAAELIDDPTLCEKLSLSYEANVPTWYASALLLGGAIAAGAIARAPTAWKKHWWGVAIGFGYVSLDETAQLHENLGGHLDTRGVLYFDWVIWAAIALVILAVIYIPWLRGLPPRLRRRLLAAAVIYVGGALVMELPLGWWTDRYGDGTLGYALIDWVEETLELAGASLALIALVEHRQAPP
jgi:hypothetical protein